MIKKFLSYDIKRFFKSRMFIAAMCVLILTIIIFVTTVSLSDLFKDSYPQSTGAYGVPNYEDFQDLDQIISDTEQMLAEEIESQKRAESYGQDTSYQQLTITRLKTALNTMNILRDKEIDFEKAVSYGAITDTNGVGVIVALIQIVTVMVALLSVARMSVSICSEKKVGQYKLTFTLAEGKIKYSIAKQLSIYLQGLLLIILSSVLSVILVAAVFPIKGTVLIAATAQSAFVLNFFTATLFTLTLYTLSYTFCCLLAYSISIILRSEIVAFLLAIFLCFSGALIDLVDRAAIGRYTFSNYLISSNIFMDKAYVDTLGANPIWLAFIVCVVYVSVILGLSLLKFKREEI